MKITMKSAALAAALGGAALLSGCATYYDDGYGYGYDNYGYGYGGPSYYGYPAYVAPSVGFGFSYYDRDDRRHRWRDRDHRREWRRDHGDRGEWRGDRGGRGDWRNDHGQNSPG